jgi:hypothetical protein
MIKTSSIDLGSHSLRTAVTTSPIVRARIGLSTVLTVAAVAIAALLAATLGPVALLLAALPLPVPLALLWLSADVVRADE